MDKKKRLQMSTRLALLQGDQASDVQALNIGVVGEHYSFRPLLDPLQVILLSFVEPGVPHWRSVLNHWSDCGAVVGDEVFESEP